MARAGQPVVWWMYHLILILYIDGSSSSQVDSPGASPANATGVMKASSWSCGEHWCLCDINRADCSGHQGYLTYVPELPEDITNVDLSGNNFTSDVLTSDLLANLTHMFTIDLSSNDISWLSRRVFKDVKKLTTLYLNGNKALKPIALREILSIDTLRDVSVNNCNLPPPEADLFKNSTSSIWDMKLDFNPHGGTYNFQGFCPLQTLQHLSLSHCDFKEITSSCQLQTLSFLDLSSNTLRGFPKTCDGKGKSIFPALRSLGLQHNRIEVLATADVCLPSLTRLDISHNYIKSYSPGTFSSLKFPVLEKLMLSHQSSYWDWFVVSTKIKDHAFDNPNLQELDLSHNELEFADAVSIDKHAFGNCPNLQELYLHSNNFTHVKDQRFMELFRHLKFLKTLSLSSNRFELLSTQTFASFPNLVRLLLDNNIINSIPDGAFDSLRRLNSLTLDNNKIETIHEHTFSADMRSRVLTLTLGSNPFTCSCELLWFQGWFMTQGSEIFIASPVSINDYICHNIPGMALANFTMTEQACLLSFQVNLSIIQGSSVIIVTLMMVSFVFRFRWHLRLLMYEVFRGRDDLRRQRLQANNFDFDIFVSYASEDLPWVDQHLLGKLEDEMGLRLCIHERDFILGKHIVDNIAQSVDSSKKILMVFSQDFVRSQWCQFELALCLSHVLDYDDDLIVVCLDDVTSRQMTSAMMAVLKTTTYIQWKDEEDAIASFWGRLRLALNEILRLREHYV